MKPGWIHAIASSFIKGILAIMLAPLGIFAQSPAAPSPYPVIQGKAYKFEKIADGVYYGTGGLGANHPIIINDTDVLVVDAGSTPSTARALLEDIKLLTDKPVRTVVNTHYHYDHTEGNSAFGPDVTIIAHESVRTSILTSNTFKRDLIAYVELRKKQAAAANDAAEKANFLRQASDAQAPLNEMADPRPAPPNLTYTTKLILYKGSREIDLLFLGRGHTEGDTVIYLPKERIVCTGDLMESVAPFLGSGYFDEWPVTLEALKKLNFTVDLPGHGHPFSDKKLITELQSYLKDVTAKVADLRKRGVSKEDAAQRVNLTAYQKFFPNIFGVGADVLGVRRIYEWMSEREKK